MILSVPIEITNEERSFLFKFYENRESSFHELLHRISNANFPDVAKQIFKVVESLTSKGIINTDPIGNIRLTSTGVKVMDILDRDLRLEEILK